LLKTEDLGLQNVHSDTKFIPKFFKELSPQYLYELLMGYMLGDGYYHKNQWVCRTVSKRLADDLQEIIHKIGWVADIKIKKAKGTLMTINGKTYQRKHDFYVLSTKHQEVYTTCNHRNIEKEYYEGIVWDVSVADNESLMVRRNGKVFISSNCSGREGYSALFNKLSTFNSVSEYYERIINKQYLFDSDVKPFGNSIRVFNEIKDKNFKHLIMKDARIIADAKNPHIWLWDVYEKNGKLYTAGYDHNLAVITYAGDNWKENFYVIDSMLSDGKTFVFPGMLYRRAFDLIRGDYSQNFDERIRFVYNFLEREIPRDWQKEEVTIKEQAFIKREQEEENRQTKQELEALLKLIEEL
jgi:hypothetical protein